MKRNILCAALISSLLAGCGADKKPGGPGGAAGMPPTEVDVITVQATSATITQELPGRLQAYRTAQVRARVDGIIEKRLFTEGSDVKAGAALFRIDPRNYQAAYDAAKADLDVARLTLERYRPLLDIKAVSKQEVDLAEARFKQAEAALTRARVDLENTTVPAPISGRIGRAMLTEGALVGRGEATLLATIEQLDPVYVNFTQPGIDVLRIRNDLKTGKLKEAEGAKVELVLENGSPYPLSGKLIFSDLAVDPATGSVSLRALFPNPERELLPGTFVRIRFPEAVADGVLRVPQRAIQSNPQGRYVLLVDAEGKVSVRPVKTGAMSGADFVITEGLKEGERVIVNGLQKARPGSLVKAVPWDPRAALLPASPATPKK
ncbi:MAG: Multidrug resistance protein MexA precursor [Betaproteobacteria bacterium ADurb.Bin341]|nr:MAG: Multidrug resistance protein MexA precursor [Betaproteobacteria bacterium ADurb.Bin341]